MGCKLKLSGEIMDIVTVLGRLGAFLPTIVIFLQIIFFLAGGFLIFKGLLDFVAMSDHSHRMISTSYHPSTMSGITKIVVGMILLDLASLHFIGTFTRTLTGDYVTSRLMAYDTAGMDTSSGSAMVNLVASVGFRLLQVVGLFAMYDALSTMVQRGEGVSNASYFRIAGTFVGGVACWSFHYFANLILNTLGVSASVIF